MGMKVDITVAWSIVNDQDVIIYNYIGIQKICLTTKLDGIVNCHTGYFSSSCKKLNVYPFVHTKNSSNMIFYRNFLPFGCDRYRVPEFPHSSAAFNIISGFRILASPKVLQGAFGDSACPTPCSQPCPMLANRHLTGLTWFPIVLYYI